MCFQSLAPLLVWCFVSSLAECTFVRVQSLQAQSPSITYGLLRREIEGHGIKAEGHQGKRSIAARAIAGMAAVRQLLKGAKGIPSEKGDYRQYVKYGNSATAVSDFYSIKPKSVKELTGGYYINYTQGRRILGMAGDRRVRLLIDGDELSKGRAVIEVIDPNPKSRAYIDRVIYKTE